MPENEQVSEQEKLMAPVYTRVRIPYTEEVVADISVEEDVKRAWRRGFSVKLMRKKFGLSREYLQNLVRNVKRRNDVNKNNIMIIKDRKDNRDSRDSRPRKTYYSKKD